MTKSLLKTFYLLLPSFACSFLYAVNSERLSLVNNFDKSIIETSVLVNLKSIVQNGETKPASRTNRRLSSQYAPIDANSSQSIDSNVTQRGNGGTLKNFNDVEGNATENFPTLSVSTPITIDDSFKTSLYNIYQSMPAASLLDAVDYTIDYLASNKDTLRLTDQSLTLAIKSVFSAFIESGIASNTDLMVAIKDIPYRTLSNIIPNRIKIWNQDAPTWTKNTSQALVEAILESTYTDKNALVGAASHATISGVLKLMNEETIDANGFYSGIEPVDATRTVSNVKMKFDGNLDKFKNFDPEKTRVLEFASKGLADGYFLSKQLDPGTIKILSKELGENSVSAALEFLSALQGDHSQFGYEVSKSIASGLSLGAVYASARKPNYVTDKLPVTAAEEIAQAVSFEAVKASLILGNGYDLNRLAESTALGSAMGVQLASVADESWNFRNDWSSYSRHLLAEASSKGSSAGSIDGSIGYTSTQKDVDAGRATAVNEFVFFFEQDSDVADTVFKTNREEIASIANGTASGSLLGNTAFAIYYPTLLQPIINHSAQGASKGGMSTDNLFRVGKPKGTTETFEIEVARALAHGAAMGAVFQIVGLQKDSMPDKRTYDMETITAVQSVTYGSTFGAITGGLQEAGEDSVIIQQAIKQGSNEGANAGAALGLGVSEQYANTLAIKSQAAIKTAVRTSNMKAASDANSNMAVKSVRASSRDMLQLMKLYNISPRYTNPSGIFSNPNRKEQDQNIFKEAFPVASPI
jgi:hypothetical protein